MLTKTKFFLASLDKTTGLFIPQVAGTPANPVEYTTTALAEAAAQTLATANPTKKFVVLQAISIATNANAWE